jgi:hypothetical protein
VDGEHLKVAVVQFFFGRHKVSLDFGQRLVLGLGQNALGEHGAAQRGDREDGERGRQADGAQQAGVRFHRGEDHHVGERRDQPHRHAAHPQREQLARHDPRQLQHAQHTHAHVHHNTQTPNLAKI